MKGAGNQGLRGIPFRNALNDHDDVHSDLVVEQGSEATPLVTIAIPTYRRRDLLIESLRSAAAQRFDRPLEIIVVDNDPDSRSTANEVLERVPGLSRNNFRYFVNNQNIGMFGNWNRCITLSRGQWLSILNDDDLLDEDWLERMFRALEADSSIDALICRKRTFYDTPDRSPPQGRFVRRVGKRALLETLFAGRATRRIKPRKLFWGSILGNGAGLIFRRSKAIEIGGFYPEEFPSADYWFATRLAKIGHYRQQRDVAASIRIAENESANPQTIRKSIKVVHDLQQSMIGSDVPHWWSRFSPLIAARDRSDYVGQWGVDIPPDEVERMLDVKLPRHRPWRLWVARILLRGF